MRMTYEVNVVDEWRRFRRALVEATRMAPLLGGFVGSSEQFAVMLQASLRRCSRQYFGVGEDRVPAAAGLLGATPTFRLEVDGSVGASTP